MIYIVLHIDYDRNSVQHNTVSVSLSKKTTNALNDILIQSKFINESYYIAKTRSARLPIIICSYICTCKKYIP